MSNSSEKTARKPIKGYFWIEAELFHTTSENLYTFDAFDKCNIKKVNGLKKGHYDSITQVWS